MRMVVLIILVPVRASNSATVSSCEGFKLCIRKMRLVALIILLPGLICVSVWPDFCFGVA